MIDYNKQILDVINSTIAFTRMNNLNCYFGGIVVIVKDTSRINYFDDSTWRKYILHYIDDIRSSREFSQSMFLDNPILFEFHCNELLSSGVLAKQFGAQSATPAQAGGCNHDSATLIQMYTDWLTKGREQLSLLEQYARSNDKDFKTIQCMFSLLRDLNQRFHNIKQIKPMTELFKCMSGYIGSNSRTNDIFRVYDEFDLSKFFNVVPANISDDELAAMCKRYSEYQLRTTNETNVCLAFVDEQCKCIALSADLSCEFIFVQYIDRSMIIKARDHKLNECSKHPEHYPPSLINTCRGYSYDKVIDLAEQRRTRDNITEYPRVFDKIKELKSKEYILLKRYSNGDLVA